MNLSQIVSSNIGGIVMNKKERGPAARKPAGPQHKTEVKRLIKSKIKKLESQERKLLLAFAKTQDATDLTESAVNIMCRFLVWLRKNEFLILDAKRMVRLSLEID